MATIKIKDLPKDMKISRKEMKKILGGTTFRINSKKDKAKVIRPLVRNLQN